MPRRSMLGNVSQIRVESTLGTDPGSGTKALSSMGVQLAPTGAVNVFRPAAGLFPTQSAVGTEHTTGTIPDSVPLYDELIYPLSSVMQTATVSTPGGGTNSRQWLFNMPSAGGVTPKSFTVEYGNSGAAAAEKVTGFLVNDYHVNVSRESVVGGGGGFGRLISFGQTLTGSPTSLPQVRMLPQHFQVWSDSTFAGLGTTLLTACFSASWSVASRWGQIWPINSAVTSWDDVTETEPTVRLELSVENNAAGQGFITALRAGTRQYVRVKVTTPTFIEAAIPWSAQLDFVGTVMEFPSPGETNGLMTLPIVLGAANDGTNPPCRWTIVNSTLAL